MSRFLSLLAVLAAGLGLVLALPGLLLLLASSQISALVVGREQEAHDAALYPDLAHDSEPR